MVIPSIDKPITKATQRALDELDNKVKQEHNTRVSEDNALQNQINNEEARATYAEETLGRAVDQAKEMARSVQDNLDSEQGRATSVEETLATSLAAEITNRTNEDAAIRSWAQQQITEKIDNSLYKIEFTIPVTIWKQGVLGTRYLPKITFGDNVSFDVGTLLILRSNDPKFIEHEVRLVGQGNDNGCGYILIDCDYYSKAEPSFPNIDIDCVLYVLSLATKATTKTNGYVEVSDEAWLDPSYIPVTENVNAIVTQNGSTLEVE